MSDRFGLKVKENAGKTKYSSLNLNQTYKGTKVETKTSSGAARHGLQSLGKVGASRRIPPPANLPSLKSENSGNDPTVSLVPSGGGGWGSTKEKPTETPPVVTSQAAPPSSTLSQANAPTSQQPLLQPQRSIPPPSHPQPVQQPQPQSQTSGQTQAQPVKQHQQEAQAKTWGNISSNGAGGPEKTYSHQEMPYFNREFPVLGGGNSGERPPPHMEEKDHSQYGPRPMMRNMHEPPWMERSGPEYGPGRERSDVYNGGPGPGYAAGPQYRRPPEYQHGQHGKNYPTGYPHHHGTGPHGYGPGAGRHPHGHPPDFYSRGPVHRPGAAPGPMHRTLDKGRGEGYGRPAILKPEDIQAMDDNDEEEEGGWAGAQDEVDYAAKLDFEDFDEDEKPSAENSKERSKRDTSVGEPESRWQSNEGKIGNETAPPPTRQAWVESQGHPHGYSDGRQIPAGPGMRQFDIRGSPPAPGWPMPYPQHLAAQQREGGPVQPSHQIGPDQAKPGPMEGEVAVNEWQKRRVQQQEEMRVAVERARIKRDEDVLRRQGKPVPMEGEPVVNEWQKRRVKQQEEMRAAVERARKRREEDELKRQAEQKAASTAKLKELELKRIRRESAKEGEDAWGDELDSIEKESSKPANEHWESETSGREHEPHSTTVNQQDGSLIRNEVFEHSNRQRNDSDSSDASRSSAPRGASRTHHHPRDIPPRFQQQQQLRQQQQQQFQPHYQQQQPPQQYQYHQQLARSPQLRELPEGPLTVSHHPVVETGPLSPSQPVRRIMKRSDSSSTAGDDIASVKSLESGGGEPTRESERRSPAAPPSDKVDKADLVSRSAKEDEAKRPDSSRTEKKQVDNQEVPVFDEAGSEESGDLGQRKQQEPDKPVECVKEKGPEKTDGKGTIDGAVKSVPEKSRTLPDKADQTRERREERRGSKRDVRSQDERRSENSKDLGKRKREDSEDFGRVHERRGRFTGRDDFKRERFSEPQGRGRVSFPVRGRGRGLGSNVTSHRGRGRGERGGRESRDSREYKPYRSHESKASPAFKSDKGEQKLKDEGKENVPRKTNFSKPESETPVKVSQDVALVKQETTQETSPSISGKDVVLPQKDEKTSEEKKSDAVTEDKKTAEVNLPIKDGDKSKGTDDSKKKSENNKEAIDFKPRGRGGFGRPPQHSQDFRSTGVEDKRPGGKKFTDKRRSNNEKGRDRYDDYEEKRPTRSYSRDQTSQKTTTRDNKNWEKNREKDQKSYSQYEGESRSRRQAQEDRMKRTSERDDDQQYSRSRTGERNQRGGFRSSYSTRGRFAKQPLRTGMRGGRSNQPVGSGRFGNNYRRSKSTDEDLSDDDYDSDSSSYTTATSASEERRDEKPSEIVEESDVKRSKDNSYDKSRGGSRSTRSPIRGKVSSRSGGRGSGGRGSGGFGRSRREVERPPRFQKQQERERARGVPHADRESGPGRGRGRGRGRRDQLQKDSAAGPGMPVTEDWDEEIKDKETASSKGDKPGLRKETSSRRGFSGQRSSSDRNRNEKTRESGGARNTSSRREPFLAERQQAKAEGSKSVGGEPRVPLPAARNGVSKDGNRRSEMQGHSHGTGLDNINAAVSENRALRKQETPLRTTDIKQFDLHNIAGVICIDDMTDDDSDISSTLSGFVEVTSRRTQKENKDRQREEEEKRKKADEQNRPRNNQAGHKKNQSSKPPRFSKQHAPQANTHSKSAGVIGKVTSAIVSEAVTGLPNATTNSNPSSANSTKRNSPVTVERPVSPPPPPVFNAWDKPLIVTPAKPPSAIIPATSSVPDPLAVGSGKPSRPVQSGTVISSTASLIEDISVDEDYIAMTKEIALLAPPEEPEEVEAPNDPGTKPKAKVEAIDKTSQKVVKSIDESDKRSQPKPQREKTPKFDRTGKRRVSGNTDVTKKEQSGETKGRKSSRDGQTSQKLQNKSARDKTTKGKTVTSANSQQKSVSPEDQTVDGVDAKELQECEEYDASTVEDISAPASDEGSEEKEDDLKEGEDQEAKDDSESESSRKDSEPDLIVDTPERNNDAVNLFSSSSLAVNINERPTTNRPVREPSPVSPAIYEEMSKKVEASRKLWDSGVGIGRTSNPVAAWEETLRTPASVGSSIVGMPVVEANELRLSDDQVTVSKSEELEVNSSKVDSKPSDGISFTKKSASGEQQNVCKVKPQQQQQPSVKPQPSTSLVSQTAEENIPSELNAVPLGQPLLTQDQLLTPQAITPRYAFPFVSQYMDLQQRQPFLQQQQLQQLQQASQHVTPTYPLNHVQQVNQARSSSSPLSQTPQDIYQSSFLAGGVYSAGNFQGTQPFVSIALLPSTTTQSFVTSSTRTQTTSLMGLQAQQPKTVSGSVFAQNVNPQGGQMYMPFDPKTLGGGTPLFNLAQHPQTAHRQLLGAQSGIVGDNIPRQAGFSTAQPTHQSFQGAYPFQPKQSAFDVSQDLQVKKPSDQSEFTRQSELVKHVNAKPFEPPKRSAPGSIPGNNPAIAPLVSSTFTRNPNMMTIRPSPQDVGGTSQSPPVSTSLISGRPVSMSPVDPGVPFPGAVGSFPKHTAVGQFQVQQQPQGVQPQQFTPFQQQPVGIQHALQIRAPGQQQQQAVNPLQGAAATILPNPAVMAAMPRQLIRTPGLGPIGVSGAQPTAPNAQRFPAPIQRPMTTSLMHGVPHMQAPRPQTVTPQMVPSKQQIMQNRPQMQQPPVSHQNPMTSAFKLEQHQKMLEQTKMFFAQQGQNQQQQQQRVPTQNISTDQQPKVAPTSQGERPLLKGQVQKEANKLQEKKEETIPRNRKPNFEANKTSKTTKVDSKPEESSKNKSNTKQDGKGAASKSSSSSSSSIGRVQPLPMSQRGKPNRGRGPPRMPVTPVNKPKLSGRLEKDPKDGTAPEQSSGPPSSKTTDQAKTADAQQVPPLSVNKA